MSDKWFRLLPESFETLKVVDDPEFTDVSSDGEIYTRYRIVRITHESVDHPDGWTHMANVVRVRKQVLGVAMLLVRNRIIEDSRVTLAPNVP